MLVCDYIVESIDGDYAHLRRTDLPEEELKLVARALLPFEITEGCRLHYEMMQYSIIDLFYSLRLTAVTKIYQKRQVNDFFNLYLPVTSHTLCNIIFSSDTHIYASALLIAAPRVLLLPWDNFPNSSVSIS